MKSSIAFFFLLFTSILAHGQIIEGRVIDKETQTPLDGATVYIDGTTMVTITNALGFFSIDAGNGNNTLIVSYVGFESTRLENLSQYQNKKLKIYLDREVNSLEEVVIGKSIFTRKEMLTVFKDHFIGTSKAARSCKIVNEDDIEIRFHVGSNELRASAKKPLKIINDYLEYEINFELLEFVQNYSAKSLKPYYLRKSYFAGSTFYKDLSKNGKADKKRHNTFLGSAPHLMLTLVNESWKTEKFELFVAGFVVDPKDYFQISDALGMKRIKLLKQPQRSAGKQSGKIIITTDDLDGKTEKTFFNTLYKERQSIVDFEDENIYVDINGNYSPIYGIMFGGYLGTLKAGDMLPRDYYQNHKK